MKCRFQVGWVALVALTFFACDRLREPALKDALAAPSLGVSVDLHHRGMRASAGTFTSSTLLDGLHRAMGEQSASLVFRRGEQRLVTLVPRSGPASFATWGPGTSSGEAVVYVGADGAAAHVLKADAHGVKDDIVLTRSLGDSLRFEWTLELGPGLTATRETTGSIAIDDASGRRFTIPAPVIKTPKGSRADLGRLSLEGARLVLELDGLDALPYPLSIDPSVVVTTSAEFVAGGNLEDRTAIAGNALETAPFGVGLGTFMPGSPLPTERTGHDAVVANGFAYVTGGLANGGVNLDEVLVAPVGATGVLGMFTPSVNRFSVPRYGHASVASNGTLYVIGGTVWGGGNQFSIQMSKLGAGGQPGPFIATTGLPGARYGHCAVVANGFLYVAGGTGGSATQDVLVARINADGTLGSFSTTTPLPYATHSHACVVAGGRFHVIGGYDAAATLSASDKVSSAPINTDGTLGAFVLTGSVTPGRTSHRAVVSNGALYVLGGQRQSNARQETFGGAINADGTVTAIVPLVNLDVPRRDFAAVSVNGTITVIGGRDTLGTLTSVAAARVAPSLTAENFDPNAGIFTDARAHHAAVSYRGSLYVIGGLGAAPVGSVEVAPWLEAGGVGGFTSFPMTARHRHSANASNGWLYVIGGLLGFNSPSVNVAAANFNNDGGLTDFRDDFGALPESRIDHSSELYRSTLYVIGGLGTFSQAPRDTVLRSSIDGSGNVGPFTTTTPLPTARWDHASLIHDNRLYVIGGAIDAGVPLTNEVLVAPINADGTLGAFSATTPLPAARRGHTAVSASGFLQVLQGADATGSPATRSYAAPFLADGGLGAFVEHLNSLTPRQGHGALFVGSHSYAIGGRTIALTLSNVAAATVAGLGSMGSFAPAPLPTFDAPGRFAHATVAHNGTLYVLGGMNAARLASIRQAVINADGSLGSFTTSPISLPGPREGLAAAVWNNRLYVAGGFDGAMNVNTVHVATINADRSLGAFSPAASFTTGRARHALVAASGFLYVVGGTGGGPLADVQRATINADGTLGTFSLAGTLVRARSGHAAVVNDGSLYVVGGAGSTPLLSTVEVAPITPGGALGPFVERGDMADGRAGHSAFAEGGHLFVVGGSVGLLADEVLVASLSSNGGLGAFHMAGRLPVPRREAAGAVWGGRLYLVGGLSASSAVLDDVQRAPLLIPSSRSAYSRLFDLGAPARVSSLTVSGRGGAVRVRTAAAGVDAVFSPVVDRGLADAGIAVPTASTNTRFVWAHLAFDDADSMVVNPDAPTRTVSDVTLVYDPNPVLTPASPMTPPRGPVAFVCSGGSGAGYVYAVSGNASGASIGATGAYVAGATGSVTDVVQCTDSAGVAQTADVTVGPGISISPPDTSVPPRGAVAFVATGGNNSGYGWSLSSAPSGGAIDGGSGWYVAGSTPNVVDLVSVVDALGNTAQVPVRVGPQVSITPAALTLPPRGRVTFAADGGDGVFSYALVSNGSDAGLVGAQYVAGSVGNTTDGVRVFDSLGNFATATVTVSAGVGVSPAALTLPPRGRQVFVASGGADGGVVWSLAPNASGGAVDDGGAYVAGAMGSVTDTLVATDVLGNVGTASVMVGPGVSVTPASPSTVPRGSITFTPMGGSGSGYVFTLVTNRSGATLMPTGAYTAGPGPVTDGGVILVIDTLRVVDSLSNSFQFDVEVTNGLAVTPRAVTVPPRGTVDLTATGGSAPYTFVLTTNRSSAELDAGVTSARYTAGATGSVVDEVTLTDSLGEQRVATITVTAQVGIAPAQTSTTPRGSVSFTPSGGSGMGFSWSLMTNASGGSISSTTGAYVAGNTGSVVDVVQLADSLGNLATANVMVGPALSITPSMASVPPRGAQVFTAAGGTGSNITWTLVSRSGGTIDPFTGAYQAGATGAVTDVVGARDGLGNLATANVAVGSGLSIVPASPRVPPRATLALSAQGGVAPYRWELMTNSSGGSLDGTGQYQAGPTPSMSDTVKVTDALDNTAMATIVVTAGLSITPPDPTVGPGGSVAFSAAGGSELGFVWALTTNASGGSISNDGTYVAGQSSGTLDTVQVTDSLGNVGTASVSVVAGGAVNQVPFAQRPPVSGWSCGCTSSSGGAGWLVALAALVLARRRRGRHALAMLALVVALPALAAGPKKKKVPAPVVAPVTPPAPIVEPPPPPVAAPTPPPKPERLSLAVLEVDVTVPNEKLDASAFSEMLVNSIDGAGMFRVISSKEIATIIGLERQRQLLGCSEDTSCMTEIANALGSDLVASATVGKVGSTYLVSVRLIDGRNSRTVARANAESSDANLLLKAVWTSSQEMLDRYGATLPPEEAAKWAKRPRQAAPAQLVAADPTPNFFGVAAGVVAGLQVLSEPGKRGSIGAQVDLTFRRGPLDLSAGLIIGPNLGVRIAATWALLSSRFRLGVGVRGAGYPGLGLYGGGLVTTGEFTIVSVWSVFAAGAAEVYPAPGAPVVALLATLGTAVRF